MSLSSCKVMRSNDEYQCSCGLTWAIDEDDPHRVNVGTISHCDHGTADVIVNDRTARDTIKTLLDLLDDADCTPDAVSIDEDGNMQMIEYKLAARDAWSIPDDIGIKIEPTLPTTRGPRFKRGKGNKYHGY